MFHSKDIIKSKFTRSAISTILLLVIFSLFGYGRELVPLLEYEFNEIGNTAFCSGSYEPKLNLTLQGKTEAGLVETDLHTEGGLGISGSPDDRAFNPLDTGSAKAPYNHNILDVKSFTLQGWYKVDEAGLKGDSRICSGPFVVSCLLGGKLRFSLDGNSDSAPDYTAVNEWVFFAITFDNTQIEAKDNVKFYVGTSINSVKLVSTHTHSYSSVRLKSNDFWFGAHAGGNYSFNGLLDNIRFYGSFADAAGVLTLEELEQIRFNDIYLVPDLDNSTIDVSSRITETGKPANVTVELKDCFGTSIPGQTITLTKISGDIDFEPMSEVTDINGKAVFPISSQISGFLSFEVIVEPDLILGSDSVQIINAWGSDRVPLLEYKFNEIGNTAFCSGSYEPKLDLTLQKKADTGLVETDLHTEGGLGISGSPDDRAFNPLDTGSAITSYNSAILDVKSFTLQGWYKVDEAGLKGYSRICAGPFALFCVPDGKLRFNLDGNSDSAPDYTAVNEWVFFAVTFDNSQAEAEDNVKFYVGTSANSVKLVSAHTHPYSSERLKGSNFWFGAHAGGNYSFGGLLDNIRFYGSFTDATGVLTLEELELIRAGDILKYPDPFASIVETDSAVCIADGEDVVSVTVHVIDQYGSDFNSVTVTLAGDNNFEPVNKVTGPDGKAIFDISSIKSGTINFTASVDLGNNIEPIVIPDKVSVEFIQAVDSTKSDITGEIEPVSADGESEYIVKVKLRDYDDQAISGRNITLTGDSTDFIIIESDKKTGSDGEVPFAIKANESLNSISGNVTATVEPDQEGGEPITFKLPIEFVGRLLVEDDGGEYSKILEPQRILAPGLPVDKIAENQIPNDGVSRMEVVVQLVDSNGAVSDRLVHIYEEVPQLELGDIQPAEVRTDSQGVVRFQVSTTKELSKALSTNIKIKVLNDKANWVIPIQFIPDNFGLWVTGTIPEANTEEAEVDELFTITFNNPIKLVENVTKITLTPDPGSHGNLETIIDIYEGALDNNWIADGHLLEWKHPRLATNVFYTAELEGIQALDDNLLFPYTWRFKGTDTTPPEISIVDGKLAVQPVPWAVQVKTDSELRIQFTEPLVTDEVGYPVGLDISLQPTGSLSFRDYDSINCEAVFLLENLQPDTTYSITVSGARDFAGWVMKPETWNFSTIAQPDSPPKVINLKLVKNITGDTEIDTDIKIYFNKSLRQAPAPKIIVTDMDTETSVSGTTNLIENVCLVFTPEQDFGYDTFYKIELTDVCDEEGISLEGWEEVFLTEVQVSEIQSVEAGIDQYTFSVPQPTGEEVSLNILVPEAVLSAGTKMQVRNVHTSEKKELAKKAYYKQMSVTPAIYELLAYEQEESIIERINGQLTVEIPYTDNGSGFVSDLSGSLLVPEQSLKAFFWNDQTKEWLPLKSTVNINDNTVSCEVDIFGILGLFGEISQATVYLSEVKLTANPIAPGSNGVRSETTFKFRLAYDSKVTLTLYDRSGRLVATLLDDEVYAQGYNGYSWDGIVDGRMLRPGLYVYRLFVRSIDPSNPDVDWTSGVLGIKY